MIWCFLLEREREREQRERVFQNNPLFAYKMKRNKNNHN